MEFVVRGIALTFLVMFVFLVGKYMKVKQLSGENKILEDYMASLEMLCTEMERKIEATRKYRHDLAGYIQTLETLLGDSKQSEDIKQYMDEQKKKHESQQMQESSGDEFLDSIIKIKQEECEKQGFFLDADVEKGDYSGMESIDKVCLFINLLDNAMEATQRLPMTERTRILLRIKNCQGKLSIYIENAASVEETFSLRTKKSDVENHGLGTAIIKQVLDKYQGTRTLRIDQKEHLIKDEISLVLGM